MHDSIPTSEPTLLRAGDTWEWDITDSEHSPGDGWALVYVLRRGTTSISIVAGDDGANTFEVRVTAATTASYQPGIYRLIGRVSKAGAVYTVYDDEVTVEPDPVNYAGSFAEQMVVKIEAELLARATAEQSGLRSWTQGGRSEEYAADSDAALERKLGYYREQVRVERGGPLFVPINATFRNA